jgi:hypothetical protein
MHSKIIARQIIDFDKANDDNAFKTIIILEDHAEKMVNFFGKGDLLPFGRKESHCRMDGIV